MSFPPTSDVFQLIETAARERFNDGAALVIRAALKSTELKQANVAEVRSGKGLFLGVNLCAQ